MKNQTENIKFPILCYNFLYLVMHKFQIAVKIDLFILISDISLIG